ncbi:Uncharacterised protein [Chryseobacterium nakagawai]|uniref:Uncharacterized protein n=1 Tax=Chryseobacterium nakagawai TaxID=1241982 RepID=A0AAD1DQB1_CHRNA|nr:hypothetical protein [Chryseobacterium nakagawai]AZA91187.1 hypothetical protein EG343_11365 [Chryseobacterium nakagawai]VEH22753.1 Uncharacterised protein [Chryseobacterium nakagawai]
MKKDIDMIESLINRNEYFYKIGKIQKNEYLINNFFLIDKLEDILSRSQREKIIEFLTDEFSLPKFNLSISILKAVPN